MTAEPANLPVWLYPGATVARRMEHTHEECYLDQTVKAIGKKYVTFVGTTDRYPIEYVLPAGGAMCALDDPAVTRVRATEAVKDALWEVEKAGRTWRNQRTPESATALREAARVLLTLTTAIGD